MQLLYLLLTISVFLMIFLVIDIFGMCSKYQYLHINLLKYIPQPFDLIRCFHHTNGYTGRGRCLPVPSPRLSDKGIVMYYQMLEKS